MELNSRSLFATFDFIKLSGKSNMEESNEFKANLEFVILNYLK